MATMWTRWTPEKVLRAVTEEVTSNAEIVGKFVETDARRRLLAITDPDWGERYRRLIVGRLLTYVVDRDRKSVVIAVGVRRGPSGTHHGYWIEVGSKTAAAHPFLRPAVLENGRKVVALLAGR